MRSVAYKIITFVLVCCMSGQILKAIMKFMEHPTGLASWDISLKELEFPTLTICPDIEYDYDFVMQQGYSHIFHLLIGDMKIGNDTFIAWGGKDNLTYDNMIRSAFNGIDNVSVNIQFTDIMYSMHHQIETEVNFIIPYGFCFTAKNIMEKIQNVSTLYTWIFTVSASPGKFKILLTDPVKRLDFKLAENSFAVDGIDLMSTETDKSIDYYQIDVQQQLKNEDSPRSNCDNYEGKRSNFSSWKECIEDHLDKRILKDFPCTPPWMNRGDACTTSPVMNITHDSHLAYRTLDFVGSIWLKQELSSEQCLDPCYQSTISPKFVRKINNIGDRKTVALMFSPIVKFTEHPFSYDEFSLLVEIGSAAGLWVGISILTIFEVGLRSSSKFSSIFRLCR